MPQSKHNRPENSPECFTPLTSFPSSHQCSLNLVAVVRGWFSGRNRDHREMSRRNKPHSQTPWQAVVRHWRLRLPVCALPTSPPHLCMHLMRSPSGSCSKCASAEAETDCTPVCLVFVFHSSFAVNTVRAPFQALIRDCYSAPYGRLKQAKV